MTSHPLTVDVLCIGHASYDLVFSVPQHPGEDDKIFADDFIHCGGGPAANAAVTASRLGYSAAFVGYLGQDFYGEKHAQELDENGVDISLVVRGSAPTPISTVLVKPNGKRALINYKRETTPLAVDAVDFSKAYPKAVLFDGHEPLLSKTYCLELRNKKIPTVLDAGSLHAGTQALMPMVDYLVGSEKFAVQFAGTIDRALEQLSVIAPAVVITLSERGLIWNYQGERGILPAFQVANVDSTGAGDAFHGAFTAAVASGMAWPDVLSYASAAGALCCTRMGARRGLPYQNELIGMLQRTGP